MYKISAKHLFRGKKTFKLTKCHSTNQIALEMIDSGVAGHGDIVMTHEQSAGRGNRGTTWESAPGMNLTFSMILTHQLTWEEQVILNMATALSVKETVEKTIHHKTSVKWPNDIYVNNKKVSGLLVENRLKADGKSFSVIGIGLNVNQGFFSAPNAASMKQFVGHVLDLDIVLNAFKDCFEKYYTEMATHSVSIRDSYLACLYKKGELSLVSTAFGKSWVKISDVNEKGQLIVEHGAKQEVFAEKQLAIIR